jgi:DpnII restriction endonuclease
LKRHRQKLDEIVSSLAVVETTWRDPYTERVLQLIQSIPSTLGSDEDTLSSLLDHDFGAGLTVTQLVLGLSKDELTSRLLADLGGGGLGVTRYRNDKKRFIQCLLAMGFSSALHDLMYTPITWRDLLVERFRGGRGSAIKGQRRGRILEDFAEEIVKRVFGEDRYKARCRFRGAAGGTSTEKADFAIPSAEDAHILIEVKAYGATGSKQTDILGDIERIVREKRHDTDLLLLTDGITWKARLNDLRKLVDMQNRGLIARIYTRAMAAQLTQDLEDLRREHRL